MTTEAAAPLTLETINLGDELLFEQGRSHEAFKILRRENPISWNLASEQVKGWWNIVRYADVLQVSRNPQIFSSERGIVSFEPVNEEDADRGGDWQRQDADHDGPAAAREDAPPREQGVHPSRGRSLGAEDPRDDQHPPGQHRQEGRERLRH